VKKKTFWYPLANIKNRFLFGAYGKDVFIAPGVLVNRPRYVHLGNHVRIQRNASINLHPSDKGAQEGLLFIGDGVMISQGCIISALNRITIEENVIIGPNVMIIDNTRIPGDIRVSIKDQKLKIGRVHIGADSFIGYSACIMPNVTIGKRCVVGALSVVNGDIPPYSLAVGSPARVVKRFDFEKTEWVRVK
jgi:acetyltransferase-like isoleucine patch superfamily enzyme